MTWNDMRLWLWEGEKPARLRERVLEREVLVEGNEVEKVAVLSGGGVGPLAGRWSRDPHIETLPRRVGDVADMPVAAGAKTVGEVEPADRLGLLRKLAGHVGRRAGHGVLVRA
jgi:hypothetical protein